MSRPPKTGSRPHPNPRRLLDLVTQVDKLTESEMLVLFHHLTDRLNQRQKQLTQAAMNQFRHGDRVQFRSKEGAVLTGVVTRINRKSVTLYTDDGTHWNVSPQLLTKIRQSGAEGEPAPPQKLIH